MSSNKADEFLKYCGVYKKYYQARGSQTFYQTLGYITLVTPMDFILDEKEGLWSYQYKLPSGFVSKTPWFRFGEPFQQEIGIEKEVFEIVVDIDGNDKMIIKVSPNDGRTKIEIILEFLPSGQMISRTHIMKKESLLESCLRIVCFCCWPKDWMDRKGLEEKVYFKKVNSFIVE